MRKVAQALLFLLSTAMVVGSLTYIFGDPSTFSEPFKDKYTRHLWLVRGHGLFAALALFTGSLNFFFQGKSHRWVGRSYLVGIVGGGLTGLPMSMMAEGGYSAQLAFALVSILWLFTGYKAWEQALARRFQEHRTWIIRNFALTFGAVVFRFLLSGLQQAGYDFPQIYAATVWLSWAVAILAGEIVSIVSNSRPTRRHQSRLLSNPE